MYENHQQIERRNYTLLFELWHGHPGDKYIHTEILLSPVYSSYSYTHHQWDGFGPWETLGYWNKQGSLPPNYGNRDGSLRDGAVSLLVIGGFRPECPETETEIIYSALFVGHSECFRPGAAEVHQ